MTTYLKNYKTNLKKNLIYKYQYKTNACVPEIKSIILHFGLKSAGLKNVAKSALALELLTGQKCQFTAAKKQNIFLKVKKKNITGSMLKLKTKRMLEFYYYLLMEVLPKSSKTVVNSVAEKSLLIKIPSEDLNCFEEIDFNSNQLKNLPDLTLVILFNRKITTIEQLCLLPITAKIAYITQLVECNLAKVEVKGSNPFICSNSSKKSF